MMALMTYKQEKHYVICVISNSEGTQPEFAYPVSNIHTKLPVLSLYGKNPTQTLWNENHI